MPLADEVAQGHPAIEWWTEPEDGAGQAVKSVIDAIHRDQGLFRQANLSHMRMYRNLALVGLGPHTYWTVDPQMGNPLAFNVVRNMCNAVTAKISKNRPKAWFQTSGATPESQEKALKGEKIVEGVFYQEKVYGKTTQAFLDSTIFGTGFMKVTPRMSRKNRGVCIERVFPPEIVVDSIEGMHRNPRNIYQYKYMDRGKLIRDYPDFADQIKQIKGVQYNYEDEEVVAIYDRYNADLVRVEEGYHLASEEGADDGLRIVSTNGITLSREEWTHDWNPYIPVRWSTSPLGFFGMGLAEELKGIQLEINRLLRRIQGAMALLSHPYVLADRASNIIRGHVSDIPGSFIFYSGRAPQVVTPQTVHAEVFTQLDRLYQRAYEIAGISQMSAQSQKPVGFESGRAILVFQDMESERFAVPTREWEELHMELARKILLIGAETGLKVKVFGEEAYEEVDLKKDFNLDTDEYVMQVKPASVLGDTPSGQIDMGERMAKSGLVSNPTDILELMNHPDVQAYVRKKTASKRLCERQIASMLRGGPQQTPEPEMNLAEAMEIAQAAYIEARLRGMSKETLKGVLDYMQTCKRLMQQGQAPSEAPAAPQTPGMLPGAPGVSAPLPPGVAPPPQLPMAPGAPVQ